MLKHIVHSVHPECTAGSNSHFGYLRGKQPQSRVVTVPEFPGSAAILAAFGAGETPALPGKGRPGNDCQPRIPCSHSNPSAHLVSSSESEGTGSRR